MLKKYMLAVLLLLSLLTGCGDPRPNPEEVITRAIEATSELQTYRFEMTAAITQNGESTHGNMQGEFVAPDKLHVIATSNGDTEEGISIGQTQYQLSPTGEWEMHEWSAALSSVSINWAVTTAEILDTLVELTTLRDEKIDGVSCFHYRGSVDIEAQVEEQIANLDPTKPFYEDMVKSIKQQLQSENEVDFWVGKEDYLLRRLDTHYEMVYTEDEGEDTEHEEHVVAIYSLRFYDFDEPIQVEPPVVE